MARRDWPFMVHCGHPGCPERATFRYQTKRDMMESFEVKHYSNGRWRCTRHTRPDELLAPNNLEAGTVLTVEQRDFGKTFGGSGFISGPGFKAFASDLPVGAQIVITATLVMPDVASPTSEITRLSTKE